MNLSRRQFGRIAIASVAGAVGVGQEAHYDEPETDFIFAKIVKGGPDIIIPHPDYTNPLRYRHLCIPFFNGENAVDMHVIEADTRKGYMICVNPKTLVRTRVEGRVQLFNPAVSLEKLGVIL